MRHASDCSNTEFVNYLAKIWQPDATCSLYEEARTARVVAERGLHDLKG